MDLKIDGFTPHFTPSMRNNAPAKTEKSRTEAKTDCFSPSEQAKSLAGSADERMSMLEEMLKNSRNESKSAEKGFDDLAKCMKIASRIMNGDIVPMKDHKFLSEKFPELYERAILMRRINPDPEEYDSLVEDDEEENETEEMKSEVFGGGSDASSAEAPESPEMSEAAET